jgi:hypothetical protein
MTYQRGQDHDGLLEGFQDRERRRPTAMHMEGRMKVRLKFFVNTKQEQVYSPGQEKMGSVSLAPVSGGSEENKEFWKYTPAGGLNFSSINQSALDALPLGAECYIDIEVVPKPTVTTLQG